MLTEGGEDLRSTGERDGVKGSGEDEVVSPWPKRRRQWGQITKLREIRQELSYLEGSRQHIPGGQIREMCGAGKEVSRRVVGGDSVGAGRVIGPAYGEAVRLKPRTVAGSERFCKTGAAVVRLALLAGEEPSAPCWVPELGRFTHNHPAS